MSKVPMGDIFLFGGGNRESAYVKTYWPLIEAASRNGPARIVIVLAWHPATQPADAEAACRAPFRLFGDQRAPTEALHVSAQAPLDAARLAALQPTAIIIAGGPGPWSHDAVCANLDWTKLVRERALPCAGFGSGAMVLAREAITGGWKLPLLHHDVPAAPEGCADGLEYLGVRRGAGLVPFAVETHATQRGSLARLQHAVGEGLVDSGWGIDEDTMLWLHGNELRVRGPGNACRVRRLGERSVRIDALRGGAVLARDDW